MTIEKVLGRTPEFLKDLKALVTSREILQQPRLWQALTALLKGQSDEISVFMEKIRAAKDLRIVFTGAGSSAFIGQSLQMILANKNGLRSEAVATTDIVSAADSVLYDIPTLLVSFSRSGESPESMASLQIAQRKVKQLYNLVVVCKQGSSLANSASRLDNTLVLQMPPESSDEGFAMTSSVSCMALGVYSVFNWDIKNEVLAFIEKLAHSTQGELPAMSSLAQEIANFNYDRLIYLGSGGLKGLAQEGAIKSLELTNGKVNSGFESAMGFRHGPKTVINDSTLCVHMISADSVTSKYDVDLVKEMISEKHQNRLAVLAPQHTDIPEGAEYTFHYDIPDKAHSEMASYIKCLVFLQLLSLEKSIQTGTPTDNPSVGGEVNRVVRGVTIY